MLYEFWCHDTLNLTLYHHCYHVIHQKKFTIIIIGSVIRLIKTICCWQSAISLMGVHLVNVPVQLYSCSLRVFHRTLVVGKDTYWTPLIILIISIEGNSFGNFITMVVAINNWEHGKTNIYYDKIA